MSDPSGYISLVKLAVKLGMDTDEVRKKVKRHEFPKTVCLFNGIEYFEIEKVRDLLKAHKDLGIYRNVEPTDEDLVIAIKAIKDENGKMKPITEPPRPNDIERLLSIKDVKTLLGLGESTIWQWVREGKFPKPIKLSKTLSRWKSSSVEAWIHEQSSVN